MSPMRRPSRFTNSGASGTHVLHVGYLPQHSWEDFMRSLLLWAIGIPLPIIIILWLVTGHA